MKLKDFVAKHNLHTECDGKTEYGATALYHQNKPKIIRETYHLEDYVVSTWSGAVLWLLPRLNFNSKEQI